MVDAKQQVDTITAEGVPQRSLLHDIMTMSPEALGEESLADFGTAFEVNPDEVDQEAIDQAKKAKQAMVSDFQQRTGEFLNNLNNHWDIAKSKVAEERVALVQAAKKRKQEPPKVARLQPVRPPRPRVRLRAPRPPTPRPHRPRAEAGAPRPRQRRGPPGQRRRRARGQRGTTCSTS